jgi:hypothetical protein
MFKVGPRLWYLIVLRAYDNLGEYDRKKSMTPLEQRGYGGYGGQGCFLGGDTN